MSDDMDATTGLSRRARRALPLIAGALAAVVVVGLVYLHPASPSASSVLRAPVTKPPVPPLLAVRYQVAYDFVSPAAGWALVEDWAAGRFWVFKTTDTAKHWTSQIAGVVNPDNGGPLKIQFFNRHAGFIALEGAAVVYRTQDGGGHWTQVAVPTSSFASMFFSDPLHGWILGTVVSPDPRTIDVRLYSTSDAGDHWVALAQPPAWQLAGKGGFNGLSFRGPLEGWIGGGTANQATVYSTIDGGITWQTHPLPVTSGKGGFPAQGNLFLVEAYVSMLPQAGVLATTTDVSGNAVGLSSFDGGTTWRRLAQPPGETGYGDFIFQDTFHWWAMRYGTLFKSSDAGQSWKQVALQLDEWDYVPQVLDANHAWAQLVAVPPANPTQGRGLATTADGGVLWIPVNVPNPS